MKISFVPTEQARTLAERGLDFADAAEVLAGPVLEGPDLRKDYGEVRINTIGLLRGRRLDAAQWLAACVHDAKGKPKGAATLWRAISRRLTPM